MAETKCPICGKNGIPDYLSQDTVCPCCGSDLSIYRIVDRIQAGTNTGKSPGKNRLVPYCLVAFFAIIALIACIKWVNTRSQSTADKERIATLESENTALSEQNKTLLLQTKDTFEPQAVGFVYTVRNGDSFWRISQKVYGTGTRYKEIAEKNGLSTNDHLSVGDQLTIY